MNCLWLQVFTQGNDLSSCHMAYLPFIELDQHILKDFFNGALEVYDNKKQQQIS